MDKNHFDPYPRRFIWIDFFSNTKKLAAVCLLLVLIAGAWGLQNITSQLLPHFEIKYIQIKVPYPGAHAGAIEQSIIIPLEKHLKNVHHVKYQYAKARSGMASIALEFKSNADMNKALSEVENQVAQVRLPSAAKTPQIIKLEHYEQIANLIITGPKSNQALNKLAYEVENGLIQKGISHIRQLGIVLYQLHINLNPLWFLQGQSSLDTIKATLLGHSLDQSTGSIGKGEHRQAIESKNQAKKPYQLQQIPISTDDISTELGDIADIDYKPNDQQSALYYNGQKAVVLQLLRAPGQSAFDAIKKIQSYLQSHTFGDQVHFKLYEQHWQYIQSRLHLLLKNGATGLALIFLILMLCLRWQMALCVVVGIPVAIITTIFFLYLFGYSINMISLFGLIMSLGIIVDDTIVVTEDAFSAHQDGASAQEAALGGAKRMLIPVVASSLTTVAAFIPLMLVGGIIGQILFAIPFVVIGVIVASVLECFVILPSYLRLGLNSAAKGTTSAFYQKMDQGFLTFKNQLFKPLLEKSIRYRSCTLALTTLIIVCAMALLISHRVPFSFFQMPNHDSIKMNVAFRAGSDPEKVKTYLEQSEKALLKVDQAYQQQYGQRLVEVSTLTLGSQSNYRRDGRNKVGNQYGHLNVELINSEERQVDAKWVIAQWKKQLPQSSGLENVTIFMPKGGPPGDAINIKITHGDSATLKNTAWDIKQQLSSIDGVYNIADNMPRGPDQYIFTINAYGRSLGLNQSMLQKAINQALGNETIDRFIIGRDETDIVIALDHYAQKSAAMIQDLPISTPVGTVIALGQIASLTTMPSLDLIRHYQGQSAITIKADVDETKANAYQIRKNLDQSILPEIAKKYSVQFTQGGKAQETAQTFGDLKFGIWVALILIYLILLLVFGSFTWPLLVMSIIPLGLAGAIYGHYLLHLHLTILSLFGLFGLSGIVINDSIILLNAYKQLAKKMPAKEALIAAPTSRLRHVLLTSITTILGLLPLLFESSVQAQFLIPMACAIIFGLLATTCLILFTLPAMLSYLVK